MDLTAFATALEGTGLSTWMRGSLKALPIIESIHVMAISVVFGSIVIIDLRLLGFRDTTRPFSRVFGEVLRLTWIGFAVAVVTGSLMFLPNATTYVRNTAFGLKMIALLCAGANMVIFEFTTFKRVASWDVHTPTPIGARVAGATSLVIWTSVIVFGRWIGFTKGYDFSVPEDLELDFEFLEGCLRLFDASRLA